MLRQGYASLPGNRGAHGVHGSVLVCAQHRLVQLGLALNVPGSTAQPACASTRDPGWLSWRR